MSDFDLASLGDLAKAQEEGFDVKITHPKTGDDLGIVIKVAGPDSQRQKKMRAMLINERMDRKIKVVSSERMEDEVARVVGASILSWSGLVENGKPVEYSPQAAYKLVTSYPWIREQIEAFSGDRANFIKS